MTAKKIFIALICFLFLHLLLRFGMSAITILWNNLKEKPNTPFVSNTNIITPTPFPFSEMTIPSLRVRKYESKLGELQKYQEKETYTSYLTSYESDELKVNGFLTIPKGTPTNSTKKYPAIVFVHGYIPPTLYKTTEKYVDYVDYLARNGFVVFKIDLRGHGNSEGEPGGGYYSSDYVIDTLNAYVALSSSDFINSNSIGLWGHSMAGNVVMRALAAKPEIPAVVIWAGAGYTYQDLIDYKLNDQSYRPPNSDTAPRRKRDELFALYGQFDPSSEFWKQVPATNYLSDVKGAIEVHHAVDDTVVSIEYSRNLMKILDSTSINHQLFEYPSGGHNISGSSFDKAMERTVEFYKRSLQN
jgi:dipeptidyl aminopeptidase/acylaminoacyl peptidase